MATKKKFLAKHGLEVNTLSGSTTTLTFPTADGTSGQVIQTDGNGNLTFASSGGAFLSLSDTPSSFSGQGGKLIQVNTAANGLEFGVSVVGQSSRDTFTGDGSTTAFDMQFAIAEAGQNDLQVFVNDTRQIPGDDYTLGVDGNNDYINSNLYNNFNNELSVGLWFKSNQLGQDCKLLYTGSWVNWSTRNFGIQHTNNGVKFILSIQGNNQYWVETGSNYINDNLWHNIFATYDNNYIRLYIDGQIVDSLHVVGNINNVNDLFIGTRNPLGQYFNGNLDEVQLWNKALNQLEIEQFINCPPIGNESGLVGYWNFEEGSGNTVLDLTVNGNDGIINGATYSTDVPEQSCQLTTINGCDSVAVLNLTITQPDT